MKTKTKAKSKKSKADTLPNGGKVSAAQWVKDNDVQRDDKLVWLDPVPYDNGISKGHEWLTECGRYRIKRAVQKYGGDQKHPDAYYAEFRNSVPCHGGGENKFWDVLRSHGTYSKQFRLLHTALEALESLHRERCGVKSLDTNAEEIIAASKKQELHEFIHHAPVVAASAPTNRVEEVSTTAANAESKPKRVVGRKGNGAGKLLGEKAMTVLSKSVVKTMKEIVSEAQLPDTCYDFMKAQIKQGIVVKEGKGYRLK